MFPCGGRLISALTRLAERPASKQGQAQDTQSDQHGDDQQGVAFAGSEADEHGVDLKAVGMEMREDIIEQGFVADL